MILMIDNYDSFTYNLVQYLGELGAALTVHLNDAITVEEVTCLRPTGIVVSPGPGTPRDAGISMAVIRALGGQVPVLGVCLGHQAIGEVYGGVVERAPVPVHGKTARIHHDGRGLFAGQPSPFEATRYHSLVVRRAGLPACLEVSAETEDGLIMALRHRDLPVEGVQFHPESILTEPGKALLRNFLARAGAAAGAPGAATAAAAGAHWFE
jgi:anthranilate synthase/aminodeoxychorismate synthase-like glutamine amidotransferase